MACAGCDDGADIDKEQHDALRLVTGLARGEVKGLADLARGMADYLPAPDADGWNAVDDEWTLYDLRNMWASGRDFYTANAALVQSVLPERAAGIDPRYEDVIAIAPDDNLFDGEGFVGLHAIERILWSDLAPAAVVDAEASLPGYVPATFPATEQEAADFKDGLLLRLAADLDAVRVELAARDLDLATVYASIQRNVQAQRDIFDRSGRGVREFPYEQTQLSVLYSLNWAAQLRFTVLRPFFDPVGGEQLHDDIEAAFRRIERAYNAPTDFADPGLPDGWNPDEPSAEHLETEYGALYTVLQQESDREDPDSLVSLLDAGAVFLGLPDLER